MRCSGVALKLVKFVVPIAVPVFVCCQPASAHSHHSARHSSHHYSHHAYRHAHVRYASQQFAPWQANGFATNGFAAFGGLNSAGYAPAYAPAQSGFGENRYARGSFGNTSGMATAQASAAGLPASLVARVIARESGGNPHAVHAGNYGLMQIRLSTARAMGYTGSAAGLLDPQTNMTYGMRYLAGAYRAAGGNENRAIALYARGYYYQAKAQGFSPYGSGAASPGWGNAGFSSGLQSAAPYYAEQSGLRHRRHYRV
jgi:soluble lytic murein transglycosylase-like protein